MNVSNRRDDCICDNKWIKLHRHILMRRHTEQITVAAFSTVTHQLVTCGKQHITFWTMTVCCVELWLWMCVENGRGRRGACMFE